MSSDTEIPKQTKKMLLFVSSENRMWTTLLESVTQNNIAEYIRVGHGTIPSWKNGGGISRGTAEEIFANFRAKLKEKTIWRRAQKGSRGERRRISEESCETISQAFESFVLNYFDDNKNVYSASEIISISLENCQRIMDEVIYKRGPVFPRMYYETRRAAEDYFKQYHGVYRVWIRRGGEWIQCRLRVRYTIEIGSGIAIRCKLNLPIIDPDPNMNHWEYDGFLIRRPNKIFWMFEKRQRDRNDHLYFITCVGRNHPRIDDPEQKSRTLSGTYLTTAQDSFQSIVTGDILMQRYDNEDIEVMREFMHIRALQLDDDDAACVDRLWSEFRARN